ncbi:hypothetical protein LTR91_019684 [Friedmanniomyces endolithicus]|uniref:F-box domain-containing protein n=1 Tax=Friedmanniomyces endolithicus TaxID=329885 RepID=A0AAN6HA32_9PEZI|nr:hypothetical protein LTR94_015822 [Friedmanniomyces endolithicus]KAK0783052.1 hypothetical protein LTR38_013160 [Friedmanniomyces endolithicus]KAK0787789.1 hypothetical protein LTR75_012787 [Friedmanniomyces endolithicus]KAK0788842.1 hypothetical protein LTR59_009858 [Friedmanniomyces endolithicus]KAK0844830.1 hypothetical protein LTR03_007825 [Friedmanniomyces endolithicus]
MAALQPSSTLLSRLPPEIRNEIWDFSSSGTNREIDLFHDACPPSLALLLTCRQIHAEAKGYWPGRREKYWRSTRFFIEFDETARLNTTISFPADEDLDEIRHIKFRITARSLLNARRLYGSRVSTSMYLVTLASPEICDTEAPLIFERLADRKWYCASVHGLEADADATTQTPVPVAISYDDFYDQTVLEYGTGGPPARYRSLAIIEKLELRALLGMEVPDV